MGLFTTLRVRDGRAWLWEAHVARLVEGAARLGLEPPEEPALRDAVAAAAGAWADARVRITLSRGAAPAVEARAYRPPARPWRLLPVPTSPEEDGPLLKRTARGRYDAARRAAAEAGCDDALLIGPDGALLECTVANLFLLRADGALVTPPARGLLPGVARAHLLATLPAAGEAPLTRADLAAARGILVTNALFLAHPVAAVAGLVRARPEGAARHLVERVGRMAPESRIIPRQSPSNGGPP